MATMAFIVLLYFGIFYPAQQTASFKPTVLDDNDDSQFILHNYETRDLNAPDSEEYNQGEYSYDSDEGDSEALRNKRNLTATSNYVANSEVTTTTPPTTTMNVASQELTAVSAGGSTDTTFTTTKAATENTTSSKSMFGHHSHHSTQPPDEYDPDFHLGNVVMDAVFSQAESSDMKQALGLCRKNAEIKMPQFKATLFPGEQAADILNCINDLLKNQTKKQICLHLDDEMNAYLKWLVLTGESKERHKPVKIASKEDFLFPSSCASEQAGVTPECLVEPIVREHFEE